jgi:hypothetical protein
MAPPGRSTGPGQMYHVCILYANFPTLLRALWERSQQLRIPIRPLGDGTRSHCTRSVQLPHNKHINAKHSPLHQSSAVHLLRICSHLLSSNYRDNFWQRAIQESHCDSFGYYESPQKRDPTYKRLCTPDARHPWGHCHPVNCLYTPHSFLALWVLPWPFCNDVWA